MKMTVKEFKEFVSNNNEEMLDEGFFDMFKRKKAVDQSQDDDFPKQEETIVHQDLTDLYDHLKKFINKINAHRDELYDLSVIGTRLDLIEDIKANKSLSMPEKEKRINKYLNELNNKFFPQLLQSLANNYPKEFEKEIDKDLIDFHLIEIPKVKTVSTSFQNQKLPEIIDAMITFAEEIGYKTQYVNKLRKLKDISVRINQMKRKDPEEVQELVIKLKNFLRTWRKNLKDRYQELPYDVKKFALNENWFKRMFSGKSVEPEQVEEQLKDYSTLYKTLKSFMNKIEPDKNEEYLLNFIKTHLEYIEEAKEKIESKSMPVDRANNIIKNSMSAIEKVYLPELLQSLSAHHTKEFNRYIDPNLLKIYDIKIPEISMNKTDVMPTKFPEVVAQMIEFAKDKYSEGYVTKLETLMDTAENLKSLYLKNRKEYDNKAESVEKFVTVLKSILATWRKNKPKEYNQLSPQLKGFALNENEG